MLMSLSRKFDVFLNKRVAGHLIILGRSWKSETPFAPAPHHFILSDGIEFSLLLPFGHFQVGRYNLSSLVCQIEHPVRIGKTPLCASF
jgi:hypothetical protein